MTARGTVGRAAAAVRVTPCASRRAHHAVPRVDVTVAVPEASVIPSRWKAE